MLIALADSTMHEIYGVAGVISGAGGQRFMVYVSKSLPPLPPRAGWWSQWFYNLVKGLSGLDPNAFIVPVNTVRAAGIPVPPEPSKP